MIQFIKQNSKVLKVIVSFTFLSLASYNISQAFKIFGFGANVEGAAATGTASGEIVLSIEQKEAQESLNQANKVAEILKKEAQEIQDFLESNQAILSKSTELYRTINMIEKLGGLFQEISHLQNVRRIKGMGSCSGSLDYDIMSLNMTTQILTMSSLLKENLNTSGLDKSAKWEQISEHLYKLFQNLKNYKGVLEHQINDANVLEMRYKQNEKAVKSKSYYLLNKNKLTKK